MLLIATRIAERRVCRTRKSRSILGHVCDFDTWLNLGAIQVRRIGIAHDLHREVLERQKAKSHLNRALGGCGVWDLFFFVL